MPTLTPGKVSGRAAGVLAGAAQWIDAHPASTFSCLTTLYLVTVFFLSWTKLLWMDELITLHIARLNSTGAIWHALASGADPNPPMIHLLVMLCRRIFGEHAWALRLPAMAGYWIGLLSLYLFLRRRVSATWALAGTVISMGMRAFEWSFESRSYAIFYGLAMLAFLCWTLSVDRSIAPRRRAWAIAGMALALAGGVCTNFFAVLAFFPVAAAEAMLTWERARLKQRGSGPAAILAAIFKSVRWPAWCAFAVAGTPLLLFRTIIANSIQLYAPYAWNKSSLDQAINGYTQIVQWLSYPLVVLMYFAVAVHLLRRLDARSLGLIRPRWLRRLAQVPPADAALLSVPEAVAVSMLFAYPLLGFALASLRGGMLSPRFVLPVCFGCAIAGTLFVVRAFAHSRVAATVVLLCALLFFAGQEGYAGWNYQVAKESFFRTLTAIPAPDYPHQPLAISDNLMVLPVDFYADPSVTSRIVVPIDFPAIMQFRGEASGEVNLWTGRGSVYRFPIVPLPELQRSTATYLILTSGREWLVQDLLTHFYDAEPLLIDTHSADTYAFFCDLSHARPVFFRATGDLYPNAAPLPFLQASTPVR